MKRSAWMVAAMALALCAGVAARAGELREFVDEQVVLAGEADLSQIDVDGLEHWLMETVKEAGGIDAAQWEKVEPQLREGAQEMRRWLGEFSEAGGRRIFLLAEQNLSRPPGLVVPLNEGADAKALASLMAWGRGRPEGMLVEVIEGKAVVVGRDRFVARMRAVQGRERAELGQAMEACGQAPVRLVFMPSEQLRNEMDRDLPPAVLGHDKQLFSQRFQWLALSIAPPPTTDIRLIVRMSDEDSAQSVMQLLEQAKQMAMMAQQRAVGRDDVQRPMWAQVLAEIVQPVRDGATVTVAIDQEAMDRLAGPIGAGLYAARTQALRVQSQSQMRQLVMACLMHAQEHQEWPADLKGLDRYLGGKSEELMVNPLRPERQPGYVYLRPQGQPDAWRLVLYESHAEFGDGVSVAFGDGRVEFIRDRRRFDTLLLEAEAEGAP